MVADASHAEGEDEGEGEEGGGDGHLPGPADGVLHGGGIERPDPRGPEGDAAREAAGGDLPGGEGGGGGEGRLDGEEDPRGGGSEDAEDAEDGGQQERIERRKPCGGAGVGEEGVGEGVGVAVAGDEGAGDASRLPAELEVVFGDTDAIGVGQRHVKDADGEGGPEDAGGSAEGVGRGRVEEGAEAGEHRVRF